MFLCVFVGNLKILCKMIGDHLPTLIRKDMLVIIGHNHKEVSYWRCRKHLPSFYSLRADSGVYLLEEFFALVV